MQCPFCQTENRDDNERCYHCDGDLSMLRVVVNKARYHYNMALEHAERGRFDEAIDELHNAIDLDRSFIPAHVVLGTIHAKRGEFDKARAAWETALSLNPELNKAHRYLDRLEKVEESLPILQTMRVAIAILVVTVVVLLVALVWQRRPDPAGILLKNAYTAYEQGHYDETLKKLDQVLAHSKDADSPAVAVAKALRETIKLDLQQKIQLAQERKHNKQYREALEIIADIESRGPDPQTSAALAMLKQDINYYYRDRILDLYNAFLNGEVSYPELATQVGEFLKLYPDIPEKEELRKFLDDAREVEVSQQMESIRARFAKDHDTTAAIEAMQKLAASYPGTEAMKKQRAVLVDEMLSWMFDQFQALLDKKDFAGARELLDQIRGRAKEFSDIVDVTGPLKLAEQLLADNERAEQRRKIDRLIDAGRFEEAEALINESLFDESLTTGELSVLMAAEERLEKKKLRAEIDKVRARKAAYLSLKISNAEATETLALADRAMKKLTDLDGPSRIDLLACAVAAAKKVGDEALVQRYLEALSREKGTERLIAQLRKIISPPAAPPATTKRKR